MIVLSATNLTKAYGTDVILKDVSFHVNEGDRVGIIGANGAGKTTLLKLLSGELAWDSGGVFVSQNTTIGVLKQKDDFDSGRTILQEAEAIFAHMDKMDKDMLDLSGRIATMEHGPAQTALIHQYDELHQTFERQGGYSYKSEVKGMLAGMAFGEDDWNKSISALSGGEKTRLALACLLLKKPDLLLLDEPTNHLDIGTLKWLEQYLKSYKGTILLISHDRYFLDQTVNRIAEIENHKLHMYDGSYSTFAEKKSLMREDELKKYQIQQKEIARQEEIIRRFKSHGTEKLVKRAQSREKRLAQLDRLEAPEATRGKIKIRFRENFKSGTDVLQGEGLAMSFGAGRTKKDLFHDVNFDFKRGERICLVGPNGIGKTTLFRMILGEMEPREGKIKVGHNVEFGYYDQEQKLLNENNTVLEELKDSYHLYPDTEMRSILGRFLFRNDMVFLPIRALSGGERARLSLLKMLLAGNNVLLLDEPTNHLDIESKEVFEDALLDFPGTILVISHDRYFLRKIPTRILELGRDGLTEFLGNYDYYTEKKQAIESGKKYMDELSQNPKNVERNTQSQPGKGQTKDGNPAPLPAFLSPAEERRIKKEEEAARRKEARDAERLEQEIEELEFVISEIEDQISKEEVMSDPKALEKLAEELSNAREALNGKYEKWLQ
jgi:ATP-binding cassette, subfamily F, member 3